LAGYSGTPLQKKLGFRPEQRGVFVQAPSGFVDSLGEFPPGFRLLVQARSPLDLVVLFCERESDLHRRLPRLAAAIAPTGGLWVAWPKKSSGRPTDLSFDLVQGAGLATGLVDNKICAIDEIWSGLRFVVRRENR